MTWTSPMPTSSRMATRSPARRDRDGSSGAAESPLSEVVVEQDVVAGRCEERVPGLAGASEAVEQADRLALARCRVLPPDPVFADRQGAAAVGVSSAMGLLLCGVRRRCQDAATDRGADRAADVEGRRRPSASRRCSGAGGAAEEPAGSPRAMATPVAPIGCPLAMRPPQVDAQSPSTAARPSRQKRAPRPRRRGRALRRRSRPSPRSSRGTSATSTSAGPRATIA